MIVGLILLGMLVGTVLGVAALVSGASLTTAFIIYAGFGGLGILFCVAIVMMRTVSEMIHNKKSIPTQHMKDACSRLHG